MIVPIRGQRAQSSPKSTGRAAVADVLHGDDERALEPERADDRDEESGDDAEPAEEEGQDQHEEREEEVDQRDRREVTPVTLVELRPRRGRQSDSRRRNLQGQAADAQSP